MGPRLHWHIPGVGDRGLCRQYSISISITITVLVLVVLLQFELNYLITNLISN